jgi:hypothetical protein
MCETVPQFAVAAGNSTPAVLVAALPVTENVTAVRAYEPPETSVPVSASVGSVVNKPTYQAVGRVTDPFVRTQLSKRFSALLEKDNGASSN